MRTTKIMSIASVAVIGVVTAGCSGSSTSARQQSASARVTDPAPLAHEAEGSARAADYWTPARMKAAKPLKESAPSAATRSAKARPKSGRPVDIAPVAPAGNTAVRSATGGVSAAGATQATWKKGGLVAKTAGKLFGKGDNGADFVASGNVVTSKDGDVVFTVGHALRTATGKWTTNLVFVPGYNNGKSPYGRFPVRKAYVPLEYMTKDAAGNIVKDRRYDFGAVSVKPVNGKKIQSVVGGQGTSFNIANRPSGYLFGYPSNGNGGKTLQFCSGPQVEDPAGTMPHGMTCDMGGGSSGGPWFRNFNTTKGTGYQISVHAARTSTSYGPYFGASVLATFRAAERD
ncbi:peptidase [Actinomadura vinacea]|uniref:Peptidase n=1 Tax=Actinomadura vinacea TaxID=115336 RepID=A0ABN3JI08_9ACTN